MAQKVIVPQKKNYVSQFLKQRDINSYKFIVIVEVIRPFAFFFNYLRCIPLPTRDLIKKIFLKFIFTLRSKILILVVTSVVEP